MLSTLWFYQLQMLLCFELALPPLNSLGVDINLKALEFLIDTYNLDQKRK